MSVVNIQEVKGNDGDKQNTRMRMTHLTFEDTKRQFYLQESKDADGNIIINNNYPS